MMTSPPLLAAKSGCVQFEHFLSEWSIWLSPRLIGYQKGLGLYIAKSECVCKGIGEAGRGGGGGGGIGMARESLSEGGKGRGIRGRGGGELAL